MNDPVRSLTEGTKRLVSRPPVAKFLSLAAGAMAAVLIYFFLFRVEVPSTPFIYVAF